GKLYLLLLGTITLSLNEGSSMILVIAEQGSLVSKYLKREFIGFMIETYIGNMM
ncbi:hypothetical protein RYX36_026148, partial [Vicia faba]